MQDHDTLIARTLEVHEAALHMLERAHTTLERLRAAARCGCGSPKQHGWPCCSECSPHLGICGPCGQSGMVIDDLCADCAAREALFCPEDPDAPIPYVLTADGIYALEMGR